MRIIQKKCCRVCKGRLKKIYSLGDIAVNSFPEKPSKGQKCPLELAECKSCSLLQLKHTAEASELYKSQYWYRSSTNPVIVRDLRKMARQYTKGGVWIDIGANDGTLLKYVSRKYERIGVEPAKNLTKELRRNCDVAIADFWENYQFKKADVITAFGMLYDSENPNLFVEKVKEYLNPNGIFVAQIMTLYPMLKLNDFSNICHEHLEYYSYKSLVSLFERNGLEITNVEENKINGGSYKLYARHYGKGSIRHKEPKPDYQKFIKNIERNRDKTVTFIKKKLEEGKKIYGYGASTKGNTILQWYGLDNRHITGIADRNPRKWGKYTVATNIPIISEKEGRKKADYFFVLPYGFIRHFLQREKEWRRKGKFIVSIPEFSVV